MGKSYKEILCFLLLGKQKAQYLKFSFQLQRKLPTSQKHEKQWVRQRFPAQASQTTVRQPPRSYGSCYPNPCFTPLPVVR
ncbi:MAG: hypothetical protein AVDCRST_MAG96-1058 [uncultured Segetibacter sp.]|uniref:Uncharacterized protein n=1 Tax=uncultured Segetibacter sp. TaxID=481133 RepID=A0A6J4S0Y4_9BACT|nr:MAG: hypothetical protein AVDCRST_MAG96-1058 [uncultured Segetibacter sp.]